MLGSGQQHCPKQLTRANNSDESWTLRDKIFDKLGSAAKTAEAAVNKEDNHTVQNSNLKLMYQTKPL